MKKKLFHKKKREEILNKLSVKYYKMEHYKISKSINDSSILKFVTKTWIEVNDLSKGQYSANRNIRFKTPMLRSDLCDHCDAYIVAKEPWRKKE